MGFPSIAGHRRFVTAIAIDALGSGVYMPVAVLYLLKTTDLTLREVHLIEDSLIKSLASMYHSRIAYPTPAGQKPSAAETQRAAAEKAAAEKAEKEKTGAGA